MKIKQKLRFFVNCLHGISKRWVVLDYAAKGFGETAQMEGEWMKQVRIQEFCFGAILNYHLINTLALLFT
jgi:hypothetical protein